MTPEQSWNTEFWREIQQSIEEAALSIADRSGLGDDEIRLLAEDKIRRMLNRGWLLNLAIDTVEGICARDNLARPPYIADSFNVRRRIALLSALLAAQDRRPSAPEIDTALKTALKSKLNKEYVGAVTRNAFRDYLKTPEGAAKSRQYSDDIRDFETPEESASTRKRSSAEMREYLRLVFGRAPAGSAVELIAFAYSPPAAQRRPRKKKRDRRQPVQADTDTGERLWTACEMVGSLASIPLADLAGAYIEEWRLLMGSDVDSVFASLRAIPDSQGRRLLREFWDPLEKIAEWSRDDRPTHIHRRLARLAWERLAFDPWRTVAAFGNRPLSWIADRLRKSPLSSGAPVPATNETKKLNFYFSPMREIGHWTGKVKTNARKAMWEQAALAIDIIARTGTASGPPAAHEAIAFLCHHCVKLNSAQIAGLYRNPRIKLPMVIDELVDKLSIQWLAEPATARTWFKRLINGRLERPSEPTTQKVDLWIARVSDRVRQPLQLGAPYFAARYDLDSSGGRASANA